MQYYQRYSYPPLQYQPRRNNQAFTITVEGEGQLTVQPDQAKITIGVVTENPSVQTAQLENTTISTHVIDALKQMGIEDREIKTIIYSIHPRYDFIEGTSILKGYIVEHQFEVTVNNIAMVGKIVDTAVQNGANQSGNIQFLVSNQDQYYKGALAKAIVNARGKAEEIAKTIGAVLSSTPIQIVEQVDQQNTIFPKFAVQANVGSAEAAAPIQTGEYTIKARIKAIFAYQS